MIRNGLTLNMSRLAKFLVAAVVVIQFIIAAAEIFFWPPRIFNILGRLHFTEKGALEATKVVANAGLYNAFLAVGLWWGLARAKDGYHIVMFFLGCVIVAGIFGAITLDWPI